MDKIRGISTPPGVVVILMVFILIYAIGSVFYGRSSEGSATEESSFCEILIEKRKVSGIDKAIETELPYEGDVADVKFEGTIGERAVEFRTKIIEAVAEGPNFAGRFTVAEWGCGTSCQQHAIVDLKTGEVAAFNIITEYGTSFSLDSNILITNPKEYVPGVKDTTLPFLETALSFSRISREYYEIEDIDGRPHLFLLCTESAASHLKNRI